MSDGTEIVPNPVLHVRADTVAGAYGATLRGLLDRGLPAGCQGRETREVLGACIRVDEPAMSVVAAPSRRFNYRYMALEAAWNLCDTSGIGALKAVHPGIEAYVQDQPEDTRDRARWAYGPGIHGDIEACIALLRQHPDSRRAILRPGRNESPRMRGEGTPPCLEFVQFLVRDERVCCVVFMRSNDAFVGLPYDMFTYCLWQQAVAVALGLKVGSYTHISGSMHYYAKDYAMVMATASEVGEQHAMSLGHRPDMAEAAGPGLLRDVELVGDLASRSPRHRLADVNVVWRCPSWTPLLESALADSGRKDLWDPTMGWMHSAGCGVGW